MTTGSSTIQDGLVRVSQKEMDNKNLVLAAEKGDLPTVEGLIRIGADPNARYPPSFGKLNNGNAELIPSSSSGWGTVTAYHSTKEVKAVHVARTALQAAAEGGHKQVVAFLLAAGGDPNSPPARVAGRTALQAAAEGGHSEVVSFLLGAQANINALPAHRFGRTAVQAAAESGSYTLLKGLLDAGGSPNEPPGHKSGTRSLLAAILKGHTEAVKVLIRYGADIQASPEENGPMPPLLLASQLGNYQVVKLLLDAGVDPNSPPAGVSRWTALQAAAGDGRREVVELLIHAGANVNSPPAEDKGRTAIQAAAEFGSLETVELLLAAGADPNAPAAEDDGVTALEGAANGCHAEVLELLTRSDLNIDERNHLGRTILHKACKVRDLAVLRCLLNLGTFNIDAQDYFGFTPLHMAVRAQELSLVQALIDLGASMDIKENSGITPLKLALEKFKEDFDSPSSHIFRFLLGKGASTDGIRVDDVLELLLKGGTPPTGSAVIFSGAHAQHRSVEIAGFDSLTLDLIDKDDKWNIPSIIFPPFKIDYDSVGRIPSSFTDPGQYTFSRFYYYPDERSQIRWSWVISAPQFRIKGTSAPLSFTTGVPSPQMISSPNPTEVILVAYASLPSLVHKGSTSALSGQLEPSDITPFQCKARSVQASWIMTEVNGSKDITRKPYLKSIHFRGTLNLEYLAIPKHGVEFCTLLLEDINKAWVDLIKCAKLHQARIRGLQLVAAGTEPTITECLLKDCVQWNRLRTTLDEQIEYATELLKTFEANNVLCVELIDLDGSENRTVEMDSVLDGSTNIKDLPAIKKLSESIDMMDRRWGMAILQIQNEEKEMIELEFNLVSIYEARRSIEMTAVSNSMSMSMKRLSWITIIFLPLSFSAGLFGMNVNVLEQNPKWQWYLAFALPLLTVVLLVWLLFKYLDITNWVEDHIGSKLESVLRREKQKEGMRGSSNGGLQRPIAHCSSSPAPLDYNSNLATGGSPKVLVGRNSTAVSAERGISAISSAREFFVAGLKSLRRAPHTADEESQDVILAGSPVGPEHHT